MRTALLNAVVRLAEGQTPDAELLARFVRGRDNHAFEELVRRHGPLVWSVCRQSLWRHADAEDAFQAVFLALVQGAANIRSGQALSAWLHGVAVRVAEKAKRTAGRRREREARTAVRESNQPVPDSTWAALMSAVHEEVQRLPEPERAVFILCDLEGLPQPEAASRLGCALGTVSGRLCRARQRLIDRLSRRGIVPSLLAVGGLAGSGGAPAALTARVLSFPSALTDGVSSTVAALARGLAGGASMRLKLFAATVVVVGTVGFTGGSLFLANAEGQFGGDGAGTANPAGGQRGGAVNPAAPPGRVGGAAAGGQRGGAVEDPFSGNAPPQPGATTAESNPGGVRVTVGAGAASTWEYKFVNLSNDDKKTFEKEIVSAGTQGWEFCGSERLSDKQNQVLVLVFKKHKGVEGAFFGGFGGGGPGGGFGGAGGGGFGGAGFGAGGQRGGFSYGMGQGMGGPGVDMAPGAPPGPGAMPGMGVPGGPTRPGMAPAGGGAPAGMPGNPRAGNATSSTFEPMGVQKAAYNLDVITLKHANAEELAPVLNRVFANQNVEAMPVPRTNQLILRGSPDAAKEVEKLLKQLDVPPPDGSGPRPVGPGRPGPGVGPGGPVGPGAPVR